MTNIKLIDKKNEQIPISTGRSTIKDDRKKQKQRKKEKQKMSELRSNKIILFI